MTGKLRNLSHKKELNYSRALCKVSTICPAGFLLVRRGGKHLIDENKTLYNHSRIVQHFTFNWFAMSLLTDTRATETCEVGELISRDNYNQP